MARWLGNQEDKDRGEGSCHDELASVVAWAEMGQSPTYGSLLGAVRRSIFMKGPMSLTVGCSRFG